MVDDPGTTLYVADLRRPEILVLEGTAAAIWRGAVNDGTTPLVERIAAWFDTDPATVRHDIESFVSDLVERGLLEREDGSD